MNQSTDARGSVNLDQLAGKYLTYKLGKESYAMGILNVREIIELIELTPVPRTAECVAGVINLRGRVIPVLDLKLRLGMSPIEPTDQTVIIVLETQDAEGNVSAFGVMVDEVLEVLTIKEGEVLPPPDIGNEFDKGLLIGVARVHNVVTFLLDVASLNV